MAYKESICRMVNSISGEKTLKRIYKVVMYLWAREDEKHASDGEELQSCR